MNQFNVLTLRVEVGFVLRVLICASTLGKEKVEGLF